MPSRENLKQSARSNHNDDELKRAEIFYRRRDFDAVLKHLEPQVFLYRTNFRYYLLLGVSSLYLNDFSGAHSYLMRGADLAPENIDIKMGLAITSLHRKEEPVALALLLSILEVRPNHRSAKRALQVLKRAPDKPEWNLILSKGTLRELYPRPQPDVARMTIRALLGVAAVSIVTIVVFGVLQIIKTIQNQAIDTAFAQITASPSPGMDSAAMRDTLSKIPGMGPFVQEALIQGTVFYKVGEVEVRSLSQTAVSSFREYRDNPARVALNRLMLSDAKASAKEKVRNLYQYFRKPDFTNFKDNFDFAAVSKNPIVFEGSYVRWKGKIASVERGPGDIRFTFFVGYEGGTVAAGRVVTHIPFPVELFDGEAIELIGQIMCGADSDVDALTKTRTHVDLSKTADFWIEGSSVRQIQAKP